MVHRLIPVAVATVVAAALIICTVIASESLGRFGARDHSITVKGYAEQPITSEWGFCPFAISWKCARSSGQRSERNLR